MSKKTKSTAGSPSKAYTHWVTRDSSPETGTPLDKVKVWLAKPDRERDGNGNRWQSSNPEDYYGEWTLMECLYHVKTYPDDDRQCIRVERDGVRQPGESVDRTS